MSEKGKKANIGEIREWGGEKYRKQVEGWVKVSDGQVKTKMEEGDVDKQNAENVAENKKGGAAKNVGLGLFGDEHLFTQKRLEHTSKSLTNSVKDILGNKQLKSADKVVELFKEGLEINEIVNVSGTPLSATIDYINKAKKNGQFGNIPVGTRNSDGENSRQKAKVDIEQVKLPEVSMDERWNAYKHYGVMIALKYTRAMFVYSLGGVGKTYTLLDEEEGILARLKMRKGSIISPTLDDVDIYSPDSIFGIDLQNKEIFLKKDKYDYITITGMLTPIRMFELMQEHNDKLFILDNCDTPLKKGSAGINILKDALDISGDGTVSWKGKGDLRSQYAGIKDATPILNKKGERTGVYDLPRTFKFTGQVIFISNMEYKDIPQPIRSRFLMIDLTMNRQQTMEKVKEIAHLVKFKSSDGAVIEVAPEYRQKAVDFMEKHLNKIDIDDLDIRTFIKAALIYEECEQYGSDVNGDYAVTVALFQNR